MNAGRGASAGALRLSHRALETHGRDIRYEAGAWIDGALEQAGVELTRNTGEMEEPEVSVVLDQSRLAAIALARATASTAADRMRVPEEIARGLSHLLAVYLIATTIACSCAPAAVEAPARSGAGTTATGIGVSVASEAERCGGCSRSRWG